MSATATLGRRVGGNNHSGFGWRELLAWGAAVLGGGAGFWRFLSRTYELRSIEAQQLRGEWKALHEELKARVHEIEEEQRRDRAQHAKDMSELNEKLDRKEAELFSMTQQRDKLAGEKSTWSREMLRLRTQVEENQVQIRTMIRDLKGKNETIRALESEVTDLKRQHGEAEKRVSRLTEAVADNNGQSRERDTDLSRRIGGTQGAEGVPATGE